MYPSSNKIIYSFNNISKNVNSLDKNKNDNMNSIEKNKNVNYINSKGFNPIDIIYEVISIVIHKKNPDLIRQVLQLEFPNENSYTFKHLLNYLERTGYNLKDSKEIIESAIHNLSK